MSAFQDYEFEIKEKKNFLIKLLEKFISKKTQLLLNPGKNEKLRKNSADLMWRITGFKSNLFDEIDILRSKNYIKNEKEKLLYEIVGKDKLQDEIKITNKKVEKLIIPQNVVLNKNKN